MGVFMLTIKNNVQNEIVINKSRFIGYLIKVNDKESIENELNHIKEKYKDATHVCYAYVLDNVKRFSDDNEPSGTAGMPILNVLESNNLNHVLGVVVRYFGGIKLGAGGLVRAYSNCCSMCVNESEIVELVEGMLVSVTFAYNQINLIENLFKSAVIINKKFDKNISFTLKMTKELFDSTTERLDLLNIDYEIIKTLLVEQ